MSSLYGALRSGVSGMFVNSQAMAMISDNIANVNTTGYKVSKAKFSTLVTNNPSPTLYSSGGVQSQVWREYDSQGLLQASSIATDMAISGDGFFAVTDSVNQDATTGEWTRNGGVFYTRAAEFRPDENGNLRNAAGYYLMGWEANASNTGFNTTNVQSNFEIVNVASRSADPIATSEYYMQANLNGEAATGETYDMALEMYDRQGTLQTITLTYTKTANPDEWTVSATTTGGEFLDLDDNDDNGGAAALDADGDGLISDAEATAAARPDAVLGGTTVTLGTITFDASGNLATVGSDIDSGDAGFIPTGGNGQMQFVMDWDSSAGTTEDAVAITLNFGTIGTGTGVRQNNNGSSVLNGLRQNGQQFGSLTGVSVDDQGIVTAIFNNGTRRDLYQVPVNTFENPNGLQEQTGNVWIATDESGIAVAHVADTGGAGKISPSSIESSTVDLASEFTDMIVTQRAYSANTKIITTADEMLEELIRTKR